jgi:hypothetical protein
MNKTVLISLLGLGFFGLSGFTYWNNHVDEKQRQQVLSVLMVAFWAVFLLGLYLYPAIVAP